MVLPLYLRCSLFFTGTPTTESYTFSLHDALPISAADAGLRVQLGTYLLESGKTSEAIALLGEAARNDDVDALNALGLDRKSTRLNSSHANISYAVFCLKKKRTTRLTTTQHSDKYR